MTLYVQSQACESKARSTGHNHLKRFNHLLSEGTETLYDVDTQQLLKENVMFEWHALNV